MERIDNWMTPADQRLVADYYDELKRSFGTRISEEGKERIHRAYLFANKAHAGVKRKSGEPYIIHPIAVATIASGEIGLGATAIVSALLHDVIEDTEYTYEDIAELFGEEVAKIVDGLTKLSSEYTSQQDSQQAVNFRKMLLTLSDDVRVMLIKLADRLHNMRTLGSMIPTKQLKISSETLYMFSPLAHRLGLYAIKTELEDLCLKYTEPDNYNYITMRLRDQKEQREFLINQFIKPVEDILRKEGYNFKISGRLKSVYSISNKIKNQGVTFDEIYDIYAVRIILKTESEQLEKRQCYDVYSMLTDIYSPKPGRIRDWISTPKANGYEALHVTVMGPDGQWIEVQIRSERMDEIAERGFAAHYKYKEGNKGGEDSELDKWLMRIRETLSHGDYGAEELVSEFKKDLFANEIMAFTPQGKMVTLPNGACVLDFAYDIHSDLGDRCIGAKVNHVLHPASWKLQTGDQVEVMTSKNQKPSVEWLQYVCTSKASSRVKQALRQENKEVGVMGRQVVETVLTRHNIKVTVQSFKRLSQYFKLSNKEQLFEQVGIGVISAEEIEHVLIVPQKNMVSRYFSKAFGKGEVAAIDLEINEDAINPKEVFTVKEYENEDNYSFAKCCNPIPGDGAVGYLNSKKQVSIHKRNCPELTKLMSHQGDNVISVSWTKFKKKDYPVELRLTGYDRSGLLHEITGIISKLNNIIIRSVSFGTDNGIFNGLMQIRVHGLEDLEKLMEKLQKLTGVDKVVRL
ncbi:MAG: RelA/SpoT family protein [Mangrovibacterium sp.]